MRSSLVRLFCTPTRIPKNNCSNYKTIKVSKLSKKNPSYEYMYNSLNKKLFTDKKKK